MLALCSFLIDKQTEHFSRGKFLVFLDPFLSSSNHVQIHISAACER